MAKEIVTVQPLSRNEISLIARLFERSFEYHIDHPSPFFTEYLQSLRTVVGLGFAAVLVDRSLLCVYQDYLNRFLDHKEGDFKECALNKTVIAQSVAEMVALSVISFMALRYPRYYEDFFFALKHTLAKIPALLDQQHHDVEEILRRLTVIQ